MRRAKIEKTAGNYDGYMAEVKRNLAKLMAQGGVFVINIDDSDIVYESLSDPDLKEFYNSSTFPSQILNLSQVGIKEIHQKVLAETEYAGKTLSPEFKVSACFLG